MRELDKTALGLRIRQIRLGAGLRQWELARRLGTTQSAIHKYERGVVPEPRRLIELARLGGTSVEWLLTGRHWEDGSDAQERPSAEVLATAAALGRLGAEWQEPLREALAILREAVRAVEADGGSAGAIDPARAAAELASHGESTLRLLEAAWRIQKLILRRVAGDAERRLSPGGLETLDEEP